MTSGYSLFSLASKKILITGSSAGIGKETAILCAAMGANVIITGRNHNRLNQVANLIGDNCISITADLTREEDIMKLCEGVPKLDGIVHCAGIGDRTLLRSVKLKDIDRVFDINFKAPVMLQKLLLKKEKVAESASIVFIASRAPFEPSAGNGLYAASKGAVLAYAKVLALELAPKGIRVNSICPDMVWTDLVEKDSIRLGVDYHEIEKQYPLQRFGMPSDVASLTVFLLSDGSEWMTGSVVDITGGKNLI